MVPELSITDLHMHDFSRNRAETWSLKREEQVMLSIGMGLQDTKETKVKRKKFKFRHDMQCFIMQKLCFYVPSLFALLSDYPTGLY